MSYEYKLLHDKTSKSVNESPDDVESKAIMDTQVSSGEMKNLRS